MPQCNDDLFGALYFVDNSYINVIGFNVGNQEYQQAAEHAFVAELYHQFKLIIMVDPSQYYDGLQLHFDLEKERFRKRPDLVLHAAPNNWHRQRMYVEVKTNQRRTNFTSDLDKLFMATAPNNNALQLGFENGVFLIGKRSFDRSKRIIRNYIVNHNLQGDERLNRLTLFSFFQGDNPYCNRITFNEITNG